MAIIQNIDNQPFISFGSQATLSIVKITEKTATFPGRLRIRRGMLDASQFCLDGVAYAANDIRLEPINGVVSERAVFVPESKGQGDAFFTRGNTFSTVDIDKSDMLELGAGRRFDGLFDIGPTNAFIDDER